MLMEKLIDKLTRTSEPSNITNVGAYNKNKN